jgi:hypothetical protein
LPEDDGSALDDDEKEGDEDAPPRSTLRSAECLSCKPRIPKLSRIPGTQYRRRNRPPVDDRPRPAVAVVASPESERFIASSSAEDDTEDDPDNDDSSSSSDGAMDGGDEDRFQGVVMVL